MVSNSILLNQDTIFLSIPTKPLSCLSKFTAITYHFSSATDSKFLHIKIAGTQTARHPLLFYSLDYLYYLFFATNSDVPYFRDT